MPRWAQFAIFLAVFFAVYGGTHLYAAARVASMLGLARGGPWWAARGIALALALSFILARTALQWRPCSFTHAAYWGACLWMGFFVYAFFLLLVTHPVSIVLRHAALGERLAHALGSSPDRMLLALVVAAATIASAAAVREAGGEPRVTRLDVAVKGGARELDGLTIVQVSDVHLGAIVGAARMERIVAAINALRPDLVAITGDLMDENADRMLELADPITRVRAPLGVFAVTGNHEYYAGAAQIVRHARAIGVRFLQDEKVDLPGGLVLYGMNDPTAAHMGGRAARLSAVIGPEAHDRAAILLHHQPRASVAREAAALGVDLMLSGHTHNGQLWPLFHIGRRVFPYQTGTYAVGAMRLHVSRGIGTWGPPMRLGSPPEIVVIRLRTS
jgi:predicted MPP superfamily phosphohydrolase